jgi:type IV pilus assembly protein PilP
MRRQVLQITSVLVLGLLVIGCNKDKMADLNQFIADTKSAIKPTALATPTIELSARTKYSASQLRDPFSNSQTKKIALSKNPIENYPIEKLHLRGIISKENSYWAAIELPDGNILEVGVGAHIGMNKGVIRSITPNKVFVTEKLDSGSGQIARRDVELEVLTDS